MDGASESQFSANKNDPMLFLKVCRLYLHQDTVSFQQQKLGWGGGGGVATSIKAFINCSKPQQCPVLVCCLWGAKFSNANNCLITQQSAGSPTKIYTLGVGGGGLRPLRVWCAACTVCACISRVTRYFCPHIIWNDIVYMSSCLIMSSVTLLLRTDWSCEKHAHRYYMQLRSMNLKKGNWFGIWFIPTIKSNQCYLS